MTKPEPDGKTTRERLSRKPGESRWGRFALGYPWELLVLLWFTFFLHQADRQIYNNLLPLIKSDMQLDDFQLGLVASVFTAVFGVAVPLGGYAGDALRRKWIVVVSLLVWSSATLLTGLSTGLVGLVVFRGLATGGGEAFYYPAAASLIAQFHNKTRALALAVHQTALYTGIVASFLAGYVGESFGWRNAFYVFGGLGVLLGIVLLFRLRDTSQNQTQTDRTDRPPLRLVVRTLLGTPTVLLLSAALAGHVFVTIGYLTWTPTFLHEEHGMSVTAASFAALAYHHGFALVGVLVAGRLADRFAPRRRTVRMEFEILGLALGAPFIFWIGQAGSAFTCCAAMGLFGLFRGIYDSNLWAAMFDTIEPRFRASATGLMLSCAFVVGAAGPAVLGWAKEPLGLATALSALSIVYFASSVIVFIALVTCFSRDYRAESASST